MCHLAQSGMNRRLIFNRLEELDTSGDTIFTGAWCFDDFDLKKFQEIQYIWSDRENLKKSHHLIFDCHEKVLIQLSLNSIAHKVNLPVTAGAFNRSVAVPLSAILFERSSLSSYFDSLDGLYCEIPKFDCKHFVPLDYSKFNQFFYLMSGIISFVAGY